jgi:hypothetical protein
MIRFDDDPGAWQELVIPGSDLPVQMWRLHAGENRASVSLVRFPAGWQRPSSGHYTVAEEFVVLEGAVEVGSTYRAGDYAYLPPRSMRAGSRSPDGCLALAYFSGVPQWVPGAPADPAPEPPVHARPAGVVREAAAEVAGSFEVLAETPREPVPADADLFWPDSRCWAYVSRGQVPPALPGPVYVRRWA